MNICKRISAFCLSALLLSLLTADTGLFSQAASGKAENKPSGTSGTSHSGLCRVTVSPKAKIDKVLIRSKGVILKVDISPQTTSIKQNLK